MAVTLRGEDLYIGECTINRVVDGYLGELGYLFLREYWGKGYAAEAAQAVLDYAAGKLRLGRMCACIDAANTRSVRLAERLGFERIAFLPEADFGGRVADMYYYARKLPGREWAGWCRDPPPARPWTASMFTDRSRIFAPRR